MSKVAEMVGCPTYEEAVQGLEARKWYDVFLRYPELTYCRVDSLDRAMANAKSIQSVDIAECFRHPLWLDRVVLRRWKVDGRSWKEEAVPGAWEEVRVMEKIANDYLQSLEREKKWEEEEREMRRF